MIQIVEDAIVRINAKIDVRHSDFQGFVIADWVAVDMITSSISACINAGELICSRSNVTGCATHCWDGGTTTVPRSLEFLVPRTTNESWESSAGGLLPSHRRSLFSLASSMLVFAAKAYHCPSIIMHVKVGLVDRTGKPVDPFLELVDDNKLRALNLMSSEEKSSYGSTGDVAAARTSLSTITVTGDQSTEYLASLITSCINNFSEVETSSLKEELLQNFSPDDASSGLGTSLYTEVMRLNK